MPILTELPVPRLPADQTDLFKKQFKRLPAQVQMRILQFVRAKIKGASLGGTDKETGTPYSSMKIRHFHLHQRNPDPILMYRDDPELQLIAVTTHAEAFEDNEAAFFESIRQELNERQAA